MNIFTKTLRELMQENGFSVRGLAESAGVSRGVVSDILAEKYVPSEKRLLALMEAMRVKTQMKKKMLWLREETISASKKKLIPKRIRKNVLEDGRLAKSLMLSASNSGFQVTEIESDNFHFTVKRGNEKVAVAVRLCVQSWEFLFLDACRVIMQTGARTALIVTSEKGNPHKDVFEFHKITTLNEKEFLKHLQSMPVEDETTGPASEFRGLI